MNSPPWLQRFEPVLRARETLRLGVSLDLARQRHARVAQLYPEDVKDILDKATELAEANGNLSLADDLRQLRSVA